MSASTSAAVRSRWPAVRIGRNETPHFLLTDVFLTSYLRFHWALVVAPRQQDRTTVARKFHDKEDMSKMPYTWTLTEEDEQLGTNQSVRLLTRIQVGKVNNRATLEKTLLTVPVRAGKEGYDGWNCVVWVKEALERLSGNDNDGLGTCMLDWQKVRSAALKYTKDKIDTHRFDGKPATYTFIQDEVPTYDLITETEVVP